MQSGRLQDMLNTADLGGSHGHHFAADNTSSSAKSSSEVSRPIGATRSFYSTSSLCGSPPSMFLHHQRVDGFTPSCSSGVLPIGSLPSLLHPEGLSRKSSFYSHMTQEFDERNMFTSPHATKLQDAVLTRLKEGSNPSEWAVNSLPFHPENDDDIHNPNGYEGLRDISPYDFLSWRALVNLGFAMLILVTLIGLFAGYPMLMYYTRTLDLGSQNGVNASGQIPTMSGNWGLIDMETPEDARVIRSPYDDSTLQLVFSDEFNQAGRSFYPGDDPYWEAADLHYWATNNLEWYDPAAITTANGALQITLSNISEHGLSYQGGMMQTWNKFCISSGGYIEVSVTLPGISNVYGLWPAVWTLGNLGRAGYGASLDGMWPYTFSTCDLGTLPNQTYHGQPTLAATGGAKGEPLSYLPGQRLSACTCAGDVDHPGPKNDDGSWVARNVPEIDVFEAQQTEILADGVKTTVGQVSQSAQFAPFDMYYDWKNASETVVVYDPKITSRNTFWGNIVQEAASLLTLTDSDCYQYGGTGCFSTYGFQYQSGIDGYITWISNGVPSWTLKGNAMVPNAAAQIGQRVISEEPMSIIMNLGMSHNFGAVDIANIAFPVTMSVDYVRVYQDPNNINIGCDPKGFPTATYIEKHIEAYTNSNLTTWAQYGSAFPPNKLIDTC